MARIYTVQPTSIVVGLAFFFVGLDGFKQQKRGERRIHPRCRDVRSAHETSGELALGELRVYFLRFAVPVICGLLCMYALGVFPWYLVPVGWVGQSKSLRPSSNIHGEGTDM